MRYNNSQMFFSLFPWINYSVAAKGKGLGMDGDNGGGNALLVLRLDLEHNTDIGVFQTTL